jgi:hypothetical protein
MKKKRLIIIGLICVFCILAAIFLRVSVFSVTNPKPWKVGAVSIPEAQITISLFFGSKQTAIIEPYNGVYRILEIEQSYKPTEYYDIPSLITDDRCKLEVYWYPTNNLIRFKDTALAQFSQEFRNEDILDLNQKIMFAVIHRNGGTQTAKLSVPRQELDFPQSPNEERVAHDYETIGQGFSETIMIGREETKSIDAPWTKEMGTFIGVLGDK